MADTVTGFRRVAERLAAAGCDVVEVPGWERRGKGELDPRALVRHHTAGSLRGGETASLQICIHGRSGLRNALCNFYQPRGRGRQVYLVAAHTAWHAGRGSWRGITGNRRVAGVEVEHVGTTAEPWDPEVVTATRLLELELAREFGWRPGSTGCEHGEWAPSRKVDRVGIDGEAERRAVAALLDGAPVPPPAPQRRLAVDRSTPARSAAPDGAGRRTMTLRRGDRGEQVKWLQARLVELAVEPALEVDGVWGPLTAGALARFQAEALVPGDGGILDPATSAELTVRLALHRSGGQPQPAAPALPVEPTG